MKRIYGILVCLIAVAVTACESPTETGTVGTWQADTVTAFGQETSGGLQTEPLESAGAVQAAENTKTTQEESISSGETSGEGVTDTETESAIQPSVEPDTLENVSKATSSETTASTEKKTPAPTEPRTQTPTQPPTPAPMEPPTEPPTPAPTEPAIPAEMASRVENNMAAYSGYIQSVLDLVNARRSAGGLKPLEYDATLCKVATYRCIEIVDTDTFSHTRPDGTPCYTLFDAYGLDYMAAGENLAAGQRSPEEVVTDWMNSPGHRANILGDYTNIGIGVAVDASGCLYWAQSFTKVRK